MRLFVAINFPNGIKDQLAALKTNLPTARWVNRQQMHLTLFFIGETEREDAARMALSRIKAAPFPLNLAGVGSFPEDKLKAPRVLWVGIRPQPALDQFQAQGTRALIEAGFKAEDRPFAPHITLARFKTRKPLSEVDQFLEQQQDLHLSPFTVNAFQLYSSQLTPKGPQYTILASYPLADSSVAHPDRK